MWPKGPPLLPDVWLRFVGRADDGHFHPLEPSRLKAALQEWNGKEIEVAVRIARRNRTLPQNSYIHVLAPQIAEHSGHSLLEVKRRATLEALGVEAGLILFDWQGKTYTDVRGTSELSTIEASKVVDVLLKQAAFLDIPRPNPDHYEVM